MIDLKNVNKPHFVASDLTLEGEALVRLGKAGALLQVRLMATLD